MYEQKQPAAPTPSFDGRRRVACVSVTRSLYDAQFWPTQAASIALNPLLNGAAGAKGPPQALQYRTQPTTATIC